MIRSRRRQTRPGDLAETFAVIGATVVAAVGLRRLFSDAHAVWPVVIAAAIGHGWALIGRRLRIRWGFVLVASAANLVFAAAVTQFRSTTRPGTGLPTSATFDAARVALRESIRAFGTARAPVASTPGFVLAAMAGVWLVGVIADGLTFRLRLVAEGLAPSAGLVVFTGALATRQHRLLHVGAYAGAAAAVVLLARRSERDATAAWFANERPRIATGLLGAGAAIAATVVAVTAVSAQVPFADRPAIVNWREGTEREPKGARQVVSPIVSTRNRLVNQSATELFTVKADRPSYWRLTALETFDGVAFGPGGRYRKVGKKLPDGLPVDAPSERLDQEVRITGLASDWLPVAYRPVSLRGPKRTAYDAETSSVLAPERTAIGLEYRASSSLARFDGTRMTSAASLDPPAPRSQLERNLALPPAFSPSLRGFAQALTASANTPFEKARALQDYFRTNFTYDLAVPAPQQPKNLTDFVLNSRRGYCEQFSTSFAAMARSIGIPARVAVGFTPGELTEGTFHVAGRNAHAWPEVYLDGFGWVPFEPTPGRAIPDGEAYTGVTYDPTEGLPLPTTTTATTATTVAGAAPATTVPASAPPPSTVTPARRFPLTTGRAMALIAGLFLLVGPVGRAAARRRRRSHLTRVGADVAVERAWDEITAELSWLGVNADAQETSSSLAARAHGVLSPDGAVGVAALAEQLDVVRWSPDGRAADGGHRTAVDLRAVTALVRADVRSRIPRLRRVRRVMDPRLTRRPSRCRRRVASEPDRG